jgi:hypothetical protein
MVAGAHGRILAHIGISAYRHYRKFHLKSGYEVPKWRSGVTGDFLGYDLKKRYSFRAWVAEKNVHCPIVLRGQALTQAAARALTALRSAAGQRRLQRNP